MKGGPHARSQTKETNGQGRTEDDEARHAQIDRADQEAASRQKDGPQLTEDMTSQVGSTSSRTRAEKMAVAAGDRAASPRPFLTTRASRTHFRLLGL